MDRIRRKIRRNIEMGRCVLVDLEFVSGLDREQFQNLSSAWPEDKVKIVPCQNFLEWTEIPKPTYTRLLKLGGKK